jgi:uncharacterized FAD-dependent dehydrogenase
LLRFQTRLSQTTRFRATQTRDGSLETEITSARIRFLKPNFSENETADLLVIGAGPAGLAATVAAEEASNRIILADTGLSAEQRDHENAADLGIGIGGAGLFSDGKFSFRPSATKVWELADAGALTAAEQWTTEILGRVGLSRAAENSSPAADETPTGGVRKRYPSYYLTLAQRRALIDDLVRRSGSSVTCEFRIDRLKWLGDEGLFVVTATDMGGGKELKFRCRRVIYAGGRMGPIACSRLFPDGPTNFRRVELGIRIEHAPSVGPLASCDDRDVKLIYHGPDPEIEWRTFCSCREGQVVAIPFETLTAYSGRADCPPTGRCNFGLNLRLTDPATGAAAWSAFVAAQLPRPTQARERLSAILSTGRSSVGPNRSLSAVFGAHTWSLLLGGLRRLCKEYPTLSDSGTIVYAPSVEGVGFYPMIDRSLQMPDLPLWVCGDATGLFRGNIAALVSGYYCGLIAGSA